MTKMFNKKMRKYNNKLGTPFQRSGKSLKKFCQEKLSEKIRINMREFKKGRFQSRNQAIAISYSQVAKMYPECAKVFKRSRKISRKSVKRS